MDGCSESVEVKSNQFQQIVCLIQVVFDGAKVGEQRADVGAHLIVKRVKCLEEAEGDVHAVKLRIYILYHLLDDDGRVGEDIDGITSKRFSFRQ